MREIREAWWSWCISPNRVSCVVLWECVREGVVTFPVSLLLSWIACWIYFSDVMVWKSPSKGTFPFCSTFLHMMMLNWPLIRVKTIVYVRLNLFNHLLALFYTKFACNLAIRYPVFRWDSCKGSVWKSMKKV